MKKKSFNDKQIHILNVAEELIAKKGFEGTSVRDVCAKAQINVAMISYYFGSKEKMFTKLYHYRVKKTKDSFSEFADTIKTGKPEMQMREIVKFLVTELFNNNYFHGYIKHEIRSLDYIYDDLLEFYSLVVSKINEIIKNGVSSNVFLNAPKPEDLLTAIIGSSVFAITNKKFYETYLPDNGNTFLFNAEKKMYQSVLLMVFSYLGYNKEI